MEKIDFKKEFKDLYNPSKREPSFIEVPAFKFLMIDGHGDPNHSPEYQEAISALYTVAYTIKFKVKKGPQAVDFGVNALEGLWWVPNMSFFSTEDKSSWDWTMMILQPELVTPDLFEEARLESAKKKPLVSLSKIRLETFHEGLSAQIMYVGPYSAEGPTIARLHNYIKQQGYNLSGKHHEIYLKDPTRTAAEKLLTIIRQPVTK
ncbi:MAG: GyrI-like domain-containing protein [Anaerolineaceae bacterium]|nr:GyrI-like domain-containing protein [Anaerolineaceae bacterium]